MNYKEVKCDLIKLALEGAFDVIAHGCNCLSNMGAGIAVSMKNTFGVHEFRMEKSGPDMNKLGCIDYENQDIQDNNHLIVVNAYTQYRYGRNHADGINKPIDYEALALCLRKINNRFAGLHIGLPQIGCGLAGGSWSIIRKLIHAELSDCDVTVVIYDK